MAFRGGMVALIHRVEFLGGLPFCGPRCRFVPDHSHPQLTSAGRKLITGNLDVNNFAEIISSAGRRRRPSASPLRRRRNCRRITCHVWPSRKSALKKPRECFAQRSDAVRGAAGRHDKGVRRALPEHRKKLFRRRGERRFSHPETGKCANPRRVRRARGGFAGRKKHRPHKAAGTGAAMARTRAQWPSSSSSWA